MKFSLPLVTGAVVAGVVGVQATVNVDLTVYTNHVGTNNNLRQLYGDSEKHLFAASYLAAYHFNQRNGDIVPKFASDSQCDVKLRTNSIETYGTVSDTLSGYSAEKGKCGEGIPHAMVCCGSSGRSMPLARTAGSDAIPQISYWATSPDLDQTSSYPYFGRTIPSDTGTTTVVKDLFVKYGYKNVAMLYINDAYGRAFNEAFFTKCTAVGITVKSFGYTEGSDESLITSIKNMAKLGLKVGLVVLQNGDATLYLKTMMEQGLMGEKVETFFIHTDTLSASSLESAAAAQTDSRAARLAWQGHARIYAQGSIPGVAGYDKYLQNYLNGAVYGANEIAAMNTMLPSIPIPTDGSGWVAGTDTSWTPAFPANFFATATKASDINDVAAYIYDAVATVGLAACAVTKDSFSTYKASNTACASDNSWVEAFDNNNTKCTGPALHAKIATLEFAGMSGTVKFGSTATRDTTTATYKMFQFETQNGAQAPVEDEVAAWSGATLWTFSKTYSFPGGRGSIQPPSTVIPKHEQNLIGTTLPILGYSMMGINWLCALVFLIWVGMESKHDVIKKSQPVFLAFICIGCIVSTATIIPISADDGGVDLASNPGLQATLDTNCMAAPWLYSIGFTLTFASLFAKTYRVSMIFNNKKMAKITITTQDLFMGMAAMLLVDGIILLVWQLKDPLKFVRTIKTVDQYGSPLTSVGMCQSNGDSMPYIAAILVWHLLVLIYGNYLCYTARNVPTKYSESKYITACMIGNLQVLALGIPVLAMVANTPVTNYFMRCGIIFLNDFGVLLFIFVPKYLCYAGIITDETAQLTTGATVATKSDTTVSSGNHTISPSAELELKERVKELERENAALRKAEKV